MASQYYGTRGDSVLEWQKKLNAAGANLALDGIWGSKTEAAYQQYGQSIASSSSASSGSASANYPTGPMSYTPMGEDEMRLSAEASVLPEYDQLQKSILSNYAQLEKELAKLKEDTTYSSTLEEGRLRQYYDAARETANNQALSRGLARSSIALNMQENVGNLESASLNELSQNTTKRLQQIEDELLSAAREKETALSDMEISKARALQRQMDALRKEQQDMLLKVQQYNNEYMAQQAQLAAALAKSASSSSSGGSSKKSSASSSSGSTANLSLYSQLRKELNAMNPNDAMSLLMSSQTYNNALGSAWYDLYSETKKRQEQQKSAQKTTSSTLPASRADRLDSLIKTMNIKGI